MTNEEIAEQVAEYDRDRALGRSHDRGYVIKMEQYRLVLNLDANQRLVL